MVAKSPKEVQFESKKVKSTSKNVHFRTFYPEGSWGLPPLDTAGKDHGEARIRAEGS